jgi:hypothetical protein
MIMLEQVLRTRARDRLELRVAAESLQEAVNMVAGRRLADPELGGDRTCSEPFAQKHEHFPLPAAQIDAIGVCARHGTKFRRATDAAA